MAISFADLNSAVNQYPIANVDIDIINFQGGGGHINVGEIWNFRVRVTNNGHLDMKNLKLHIEGLSPFSLVSFNPIFGFTHSIFTGSQDVDAHTTVTFGPFWMRATQATGGGGTENEDIVTAHISTFDAGLDHILKDHGHHAQQPEAKYHRHIHPD